MSSSKRMFEILRVAVAVYLLFLLHRSALFYLLPRTDSPSWLSLMESAYHFVQPAAVFFLFYLLFYRKRRFPTMFIIFLSLSFIFHAVDIVSLRIMAESLADLPGATMFNLNAYRFSLDIRLLFTLAVTLVFIPYFSASRHVKEYFTR